MSDLETPDTKHTPVASGPAPTGGTQHHYRLPNGRGASVVRGGASYGHESGLWELAVLDADGELNFRTTVTEGTNGVLGKLTDAGVQAGLDAIAALPKEADQ